MEEKVAFLQSTYRTPNLDVDRLTDLGNAERLVTAHGRDLRYAIGLGWHAWDGRRWSRDDADGEVMRRAQKTVRSLHRIAAEVDDRETRKDLTDWANKSESLSRLSATVSLAQTQLGIIVQAKDLDADPWLFNAANGTVDLRTGELREHRRDDLMTQLADTVYESDAVSELWTQTLERVTGGDEEIASFLQRAIGSTLAGETQDKLFFCHGPGATGKSTFLEAIRTAVGEYSATADFQTFIKGRDRNASNDIARLAGKRLVVSLEVDDGKALAEGLLKSMTGGDTITARFLYGESFEFMPRFTLWLAANARPKVNADDTGMWRRIVQIPFVHVIPEEERDEAVKVRLRSDPEVQSAILAWAVEGCLAWQRDGLRIPDEVRLYTEAYRAENDPLQGWIAENCELAATAFTSTAALRLNYQSWVLDAGEQQVTAKEFARSLTSKGCESARGTGGVRGWRGIRLAE